MTTTVLPDIQEIMKISQEAFVQYRQVSLSKRAELLEAIADGIDASGNGLIECTMAETNLPEARLLGERARTTGQLRQFANACRKGTLWQNRIDQADANRTPPKPEIRKTMVPLGPVVVFAASNFPYAFSTAGGDTASALAAGCTVVVKGHSAHPATSAWVANIVQEAVAKCQLPAGVFQHVLGPGNVVGEQLVKHPLTAAVGFTGSFSGGKQLYDWGVSRPVPIPVFAEMSSVNPVFLLPAAIAGKPAEWAAALAGSVMLGVGQFCTNPGIMVGLASPQLDAFIAALAEAITKANPAKMLHPGIASSYHSGTQKMLAQQGIQLVAKGAEANPVSATPMIAKVKAQDFLNNPALADEVFGPWSILVECENTQEVLAIANSMHGQLTTTLIANDADAAMAAPLLQILPYKCGRIIVNGVPTGVEVCPAMNHGGPFPATTDSRFTAVGIDAALRFLRPVAYQTVPQAWLPEQLQHT